MSTNARFSYQDAEIDVDDETTTTIEEIIQNNKPEIIIKDLDLEKKLDDISLCPKTNDKSSFLSLDITNKQKKIKINFPNKDIKEYDYFPQQKLDEFRKKNNITKKYIFIFEDAEVVLEDEKKYTLDNIIVNGEIFLENNINTNN